MDSNLDLSQLKQGVSLEPVVKTIAQEEINRYAEASGDFNPIHIDEDFAKKTPLEGTIAHGMLVLASLVQMLTQAFANHWVEGGKLSVRFKAPARPGDTITTQGKVDSVEAEGGDTRVSLTVACLNQNGETVIAGGAEVRI